eukprot:349706-Chlamydomonas_euryale.AAC.5
MGEWMQLHSHNTAANLIHRKCVTRNLSDLPLGDPCPTPLPVPNVILFDMHVPGHVGQAKSGSGSSMPLRSEATPADAAEFFSQVNRQLEGFKLDSHDEVRGEAK